MTAPSDGDLPRSVVPPSPDEITAAWLERYVGHVVVGPLTGVEMTRIGEGGGLVSHLTGVWGRGRTRRGASS